MVERPDPPAAGPDRAPAAGPDRAPGAAGGPQTRDGRLATLRRVAPGAVAGLVAGVVLSLVAAAATGGLGARGPEVVLVAIAPGTAERIARGEATSPIPSDLRLRPGDTLVVRNDDSAVHGFGGYRIPPGTILTLPIAAADRGRFVCTFHPSGSLALDVAEPPSPLGIATTSLLVGLPLGLLLGGLSVLLGRLEAPEARPGPPIGAIP